MDPSSPKKSNFCRCAVHLYKDYEHYLQEHGYIDFSDMIYDAIDAIKDQPDTYVTRYDHVLVDEYQDISKERVTLLKQLVNGKSKTKLFCVGDDWQSIYSFSGSDVRFILEFANDFSEPAIIKMGTNYRCPCPIVKAADHIMSYCQNKVSKTIRAKSFDGSKPFLHVLDTSKNHFTAETAISKYAYKMIANLIDRDKVRPENIMVVTRFRRYLEKTEILCKQNSIPCGDHQSGRSGVKLETVHGTKGMESDYVLVLGIVRGNWGFPPDMKDSELLEPVRMKTASDADEERRLFCVALTRCVKEVHLLTIAGDESRFIDELRNHVEIRKHPRFSC